MRIFVKTSTFAPSILKKKYLCFGGISSPDSPDRHRGEARAAKHRSLNKNPGGLAQLARAFDWQSKGHRFDSDILHTNYQAVTTSKW